MKVAAIRIRWLLRLRRGWGKPELGPNTTGLGQVYWYEIKDTTASYTIQEIRELQDYIVAPLFKAVNGVEEVIGWGGYEKQYSVIVDTKKLQNFRNVILLANQI